MNVLDDRTDVPDRFSTAVYTVSEAARYLDVPASTLTTWAHGYRRHPHGYREVLGAPILTTLPAQFGLAHALASRRLYTDGAEVLFDYAEAAADPGLVRAASELVVVRNGQRVFNAIVSPPAPRPDPPGHPEGLPELFLNRSLGRRQIPELLRAAGLRRDHPGRRLAGPRQPRRKGRADEKTTASATGPRNAPPSSTTTSACSTSPSSTNSPRPHPARPVPVHRLPRWAAPNRPRQLTARRDDVHLMRVSTRTASTRPATTGRAMAVQ